MISPLLMVSVAVLPNEGEDSFALSQGRRVTALCVADGCGGLGSRRYAQWGMKTGAYLAARQVSQAFWAWTRQTWQMPQTPTDGEALRQALQSHVQSCLQAFAKGCKEHNSTRITGSMQRTFPSTLCGALMETSKGTKQEVCFLWAGDSRGYVLDENGLHQCTQDHLRGQTDPFESLYQDRPLARLFSLDNETQLSVRRLTLHQPSLILLATDGAYSSLPTPMEFEMLLLDTLKGAVGWQSWQRKLSHSLAKLAQDDVTLLLAPCLCDDWEAFRQMLLKRRETLQKAFITPVRRKKYNVDVARDKWRAYQPVYDWTEEAAREGVDWRL